MLKVAVIKVSPHPWGGRGFGVDERGREIWFKTAPPGVGLWAGNRHTAQLARQISWGDGITVIEIDDAQIRRAEETPASEAVRQEFASAFRAYDQRSRLWRT